MYTTVGTTYKWRPLPNPSQSFRLLTLKSSPDLKDPIHCTLQEYATAESCPDYDTISYLCGNPEDSRLIFIENHSVNVYASLESALCHIRWLNRGQDLVLWADAVCINQADLAEKSAQVANLDRIYRGHGCHVWLGEAVESTNVAFEVIDRITATDWLRSYVKRDDDVRNLKDLSELVSDEEAEAVAEVFRRSYWTRLWTFQELVLAKEHAVVFMCGEKVCSAYCLGRALLQLRMAPNVEFEVPERFYSQYVQVFQKQLGLPRHKTTLLEQLVRREGLECADKRDEVFVTINMSDETQLKKSNFPDYSLTLQQVHQRLVRTWIEVKKNLDILMIGDSIELQWPARMASPESVISGSLYTSICQDAIPDANPMAASGSHESRCKVLDTENGNMDLLLEGILVAQISQVGPSKGSIDNGELLEEESDSDAEVDQTGDDSFWRFLQVDRPNTPLIEAWKELIPTATTTTSTKLVNEDFWLMLTSSKKRWRDSTDLQPDLRKDIEQLARGDVQEWPRDAWLEKHLVGVVGSAVFNTCEGSMGFARSVIKPRDLICVLFGGQLPFVLRPVDREGNRYLLINECYLYGVMDGEAVTDLEHGKYEKKWFRLAGMLPDDISDEIMGPDEVLVDNSDNSHVDVE